MFPSLNFKICPSFSYFLSGTLLLSPISFCRVLVAEGLIDGHTEPALTALTRRVEWFAQEWPGVWTGVRDCGTSPGPWGLTCAKLPYESMVAEGGSPYNLVAAFCISRDKCYIASIPRGGEATRWLQSEMQLSPRWLQAHGGIQNQVLHAEDLAIGGASSHGARYPYTNGAPPPPAMFVWGLYASQNRGTNPPRDNYGEASERQPCTMTDPNGSRPTSSCTMVLTQLGITWNQASMREVPW